jgi:hypothetical protein
MKRNVVDLRRDNEIEKKRENIKAELEKKSK